jgi:cytochrome c peroxidase
MASAFTTRAFSRAPLRAYRSAARAPLQRSAPRALLQAQAGHRQQSRRGYSSEAPPSGGSGGGSGAWVWLLGAAAVGGGGYYAYSQGLFDGSGASAAAKPFAPKFEDYQAVYDAVAKKLADETDYDDGSYGPVLLRLAWHASGTYVLQFSRGRL